MVVPMTAENLLFSLLSVASLLLYSRTSRYNYQAVKSYMRRAFSLRDALSPYFTLQEILFFRWLQWEYGMLISGSTALKFFNRAPFNDEREGESDLDLYVELRFCEPIAKWLMKIGYTFERRTNRTPKTFKEALRKTSPLDIDFLEGTMFYLSSERPYIGRGIANVFNFWRDGRKIQLIASDSSPLEIILNFHSTCVMSIITYAKAYCFYPKATFEESRSLLHSTQGTNQDAAIKKYEKRGWVMVHGMPPGVERDDYKSAFFPCKRFVGDGKCWTIALDPVMPFGQPQMQTGLGQIAMSHPIEANSWELCFANERDEYKAEMVFYNLSSPCFKFRYMVADPEVADYVQIFFGSIDTGFYSSRQDFKDNDLRIRTSTDCVNPSSVQSRSNP
ncbi:hypothetical protein BJ165DRAFT_1396099 [Panaeolus papilionaceus]|nr:hypothetical protein BJ165DRAFT_1396099 [Panaeolus papilionaceus]